MSENTAAPEKSPEKSTKESPEKKIKETPEKKTNESTEKKKNEEVSLEGKKSKGTSSRPPISEMVDAAIFALEERGGSSLSAIKKYMGATFKIDTKKSASYIRRYILEAVDSEHLIQSKGSGATGSFKLSAEAKRLAERSAGIANRTYLPKKPHKRYAKPNHPPFYQMIDTAIITLNEKYGSSLQAVKKYLAEHYKVDTKKKASIIKNYINSALANGQYLQTKGSGAAGSFRIPHSDEDRKKMAKADDKVVKKSSVIKKPVKRLGKPKASKKQGSPKKKKVEKPKKPVAEKKKEVRKPPKPRGIPSTNTPVKEKSKVSSPAKRGKPTKRSPIPAKPDRSAAKSPVTEKRGKPASAKKEKTKSKKSSSPAKTSSTEKRRSRR